MRIAALFSGGKDSTFAIHAARMMGHSVVCLVTVRPASEDSRLLHHPNIGHTMLQAEAMGIPHVVVSVDAVGGGSGGGDATDPKREVDAICDALSQARDDHGIDGVVHGGILSGFQRTLFGTACGRLGLEAVAPIWGEDQTLYMRRLVRERFVFIITSVTSDGLDGSWLGRPVTADGLAELERLSAKHSFNVSFEGGEAETFVVDCPLFSHPIRIDRASTRWDGYRGRFEILEAGLDSHA